MVPMMLLEGSASAIDALTTALGTVATDAIGGIAAIVPIAAPVMGGILVVRIGIRAFKSFSK